MLNRLKRCFSIGAFVFQNRSISAANFIYKYNLFCQFCFAIESPQGKLRAANGRLLGKCAISQINSNLNKSDYSAKGRKIWLKLILADSERRNLSQNQGLSMVRATRPGNFWPRTRSATRRNPGLCRVLVRTSWGFWNWKDVEVFLTLFILWIITIKIVTVTNKKPDYLLSSINIRNYISKWW